MGGRSGGAATGRRGYPVGQGGATIPRLDTIDRSDLDFMVKPVKGGGKEHYGLVGEPREDERGGKWIEVRGSAIDPAVQGQGYGTGMYIAAMQESLRQGRGFRSDSRTLSPAAERVWKGLRARLPAGAMERGRNPSGFPQYSITAEHLAALGDNFNWASLESGGRRRRSV